MAHQILVVESAGNDLSGHLDPSGWPLIPPTLLTVHRTSDKDERSRQIVCKLDGKFFAELLFGETCQIEIHPGRHTFFVHNTLVWKTIEFDAAPGAHAHFTVWNRAWSGYYVMLLMLGAAPLGLGVCAGAPVTAPSPPAAIGDNPTSPALRRAAPSRPVYPDTGHPRS